MEFDVLFLFTPRNSKCQTFNAFVAVTGDMTVGEMIVAAQDYLIGFLQQQHQQYSRGHNFSCDATEYDIDFHLSLD